MIPALAKLEDPIRRWFESQSSPPVAIISDFFLGWTHRLAVKLGIKRVVFSPSGAMGLSVVYSLWRDMPKKPDQDENGDVLFKDVPNCPKYPWWQLSPVYRSYVEGDADSELIKEGYLDNMASWGLVVNSFDDLEGVYKDHLMNSLSSHDDRVWTVGPLASPRGHEDRGGVSSIEVSKISSWLDMCQDDEVVYVSFGTQALLTSQQMEVIAQGLERSGVKFIWVVRDVMVQGDHGKMDLLEFEERVKGRGVVIKGWAPQVTILSHRAVGTFLTHCGWNSTLEGIMAGVRLLVWPMGADQFSNATLLVDHLKIGVRVYEGFNMVHDPCELAQILVNSVTQDQDGRKRIKKMQNNALEALSENGSSFKTLLRLVNKLCELNEKEC